MRRVCASPDCAAECWRRENGTWLTVCYACHLDGVAASEGAQKPSSAHYGGAGFFPAHSESDAPPRHETIPPPLFVGGTTALPGIGGAIVTADPLDDLYEFFSIVRQRMEIGRAEYGDKSFSKHPRELLREMAEEALDVAGWGFILWRRLDGMIKALETTDE